MRIGPVTISLGSTRIERHNVTDTHLGDSATVHDHSVDLEGLTA